MRKLFVVITLCLPAFWSGAQELNFNVKINVQRLQTADPVVFETLEQTITEFVNSQKWTNDVFEQEERIQGNLLLTITDELSPTRFKADLAIQSSRPVFNSSYQTALLNHIDKEVVFDYEQFQPLYFTRNAYNDNLSSVLSFYVYLILGLDYDSFSPFGGEEYFQIAQEIVNNVPQSVAAAVGGWRSLDGNFNRYWIIENILSPRVRPYRQAMYDFHRQSLDIMADDPAAGRAVMLQALQAVRDVNQAYPNSMIIQMFVNTKGQEVTEIFKVGDLTEKNTFIQVMSRIDPSNSGRYRAVK